MDKILVCVFSALLFFFGTEAYASDAEEVFELAWNNPTYTQYKLRDVDINRVLERYYETSPPVHFTREMLWDMETKKAWDPKTYISYVVREGKSWGKEILENGNELFVRSSEQRQWLNGDVYEEVFEKVYINHLAQKVTFLGTQCLKNSSGEWVKLNNQQPLFHVQHSVEGDENNPINVWRVVYLTEGKDQRFIDALDKLDNPTKLPGFVEIYIEKDLGVHLSHR